MNPHDLLKAQVYTLRNGGTTLMRGIGSTWVTPDPDIHGRFAVGGFAETVTADAEYMADAIERQARNVQVGQCIGTWEQAGTIYVDVVQLFFSFHEAMIEADGNGEQAIFDLAEGTEHDVERYWHERECEGEEPAIRNIGTEGEKDVS